MKIRINNLYENGLDGRPDYKGLDLSKIQPGSQVYKDNSAVFEYNGDIPEHADLLVITEKEYSDLRNALPKTEFEILKEKQDLMQQALDELIFGGGF